MERDSTTLESGGYFIRKIRTLPLPSNSDKRTSCNIPPGRGHLTVYRTVIANSPTGTGPILGVPVFGEKYYNFFTLLMSALSLPSQWAHTLGCGNRIHEALAWRTAAYLVVALATVIRYPHVHAILRPLL